MPFFSETAAAALAGRTVRASQLVFLDFATAPMRVWLGFGPLVAGGFTWSGLGELGSISGLESPLGGTAPVTTLALSGVKPELISAARDASAEVTGRSAIVSIQFFDDAWQPLDAPYAIMSGIMDRISIAAPDVDTRQVQVSVEWLFTRRAIPPFGMLSDRDQKALFPGDRGLEQMSAMQNKSTVWPSY
ncbi:hypothetical protein [Nocardioides sp. NPDC004968]|uniref:hypothetical protein n=1 Tax=Nocardioides sp. NPDC004968 TaxID=3155894 RepID=UPI0033BEF4F4